MKVRIRYLLGASETLRQRKATVSSFQKPVQNAYNKWFTAKGTKGPTGENKPVDSALLPSVNDE